MSDYSYCPYCDEKIEMSDLLKPSEFTKVRHSESSSCPYCGRYIRFNVEVMPELCIYSEEVFLEKTKKSIGKANEDIELQENVRNSMIRLYYNNNINMSKGE